VSGRSRLVPILILLLASAIRFHALTWDARFHPDEALFATFARSAAVQGDWLLHSPLDKTPLSIYANALSMMLVGVKPLPNGVLTLDMHQGEFAARVPATFASILLVAVMYAAARTLYRRRGTSAAPLLAMLLTALSPLAVAFSATAFTDGLMLLCIALALWRGSAGRWLWAGIWLALGYACKQQALLYLPLLALLYFLPPRRPLVPAVIRLLLPLALTFGLLALWDNARGEVTGVWALALANNEPSRLVRSDELLPRLATWAGYAATLAAPLTLPFALLALTAFINRLRTQPLRRNTFADLLLVLYIVGYAGLHWLVALNIYDRYLLPLLPPILLLFARGLEWGWKCSKGKLQLTAWKSLSVYGEGFREGWFATLLLCAFAFCLFASWRAVEGRASVGGDRGEHTGIDQLAAYLEGKPLGTIIYDHWLGWELGYYLGTWSDKRRVYYPDPDALAADARLQADPAPRYLPAPADQPVSPWLEALREAGFDVSLVYHEAGFVVYQLIPPAGG
jgi:4-amino-4-deoxy-L-arabinose transferase-like glycosyltransferase